MKCKINTSRKNATYLSSKLAIIKAIPLYLIMLVISIGTVLVPAMIETWDRINWEITIFVWSITLMTWVLMCLLCSGILIFFSYLIVLISEKKYKIKYGITNISITKDKYTEKTGDYSLEVKLSDINSVREYNNSFYAYVNKTMFGFKLLLMFNKNKFEDKKDYDKLIKALKK